MDKVIELQTRKAEEIKIELGDFRDHEDGIAQAFAEQHKDRFRFCHTVGKWYEWSGQIWRQTEIPIARHAARELVREVNKTHKAGLAKARTASAIEQYAQADPAFAVTSKIWDQDPWLLGTPGGTVDLRTGDIFPGQPDHFITRQTNVTPAEIAGAPIWSEFLNQATQGDPDMQAFMRRVAGYCLTGVTREHALFFIYGDGGNGKGTFLNTISNIMDGYAVTAPMDAFTASKHDQHPTAIAMLEGARLVSASETEEWRKWAEARIKLLTGGDRIRARFMRQDFFEYLPQFKLVVIGNHKPTLSNIDEAIKRRFNLIPFIHKPVKPDLELEGKLVAEYPAILRWMIDGCLEWQRDGLNRPATVETATAEYFDEQDVFGRWLEERCIVEPGNRGLFESRGKLFADWSDFAKKNGETAGTSKSFATTMLRHGFDRDRRPVNGKTQRGYVGVELYFEQQSRGFDQ